MIKSKYTMIILKLIEAKLDSGNRNTINIRYSRRVQEWFLGKKRLKNWTTTDSLNKLLNVALKEIESKYTLITSELNTMIQ